MYEWAGQERTVDVSKRSLTEPGYKTVFAKTTDIAELAKVAHASTEGRGQLKGLNSAAFVDAMTETHAAWNRVHPFPEGNGRALNLMMTQLAKEAGHEVNFRRVPGDFWLDAAETSLQRVNIDNPHDTRRADLTELREIFEYVTDSKPERAIALETIRLNQYDQPDRMSVQAFTAKSVAADPEFYIDNYKRKDEAFEGRYVAADLFKETFDEYAQSKDARNRYNGPVHNSAAVLSSALFNENLADKSNPERDTVVFLTGTPGAGKTSSVLQGSKLADSTLMVFEGQLSSPLTTIEKIQKVLDAGLKPEIIVVHALPENALANTFKRQVESGRGASIDVMASIQGRIPDSLQEVYKQYGEAVSLKIMDVRDRENSQAHQGWQHLDLLRSEGNYEQIKQRLSAALEQARTANTIGEKTYRQAAGLPPLDKHIGLDRRGVGSQQKDAPGRSIPPANSQAVVVKDLKKEISRER